MWLMLEFVLTLFASIFAIYCVYGLVTEFVPTPFHTRKDRMQEVNSNEGPVFRAVIVPDVTGPSFLGRVRWQWQIQEQATSGGWITRQSGKQLTHKGARRKARTVLQYVRKGPEIIA